MYTLGVNGWANGIHDPAAAIFRDGELIAAVEEERLSRQKHAFDQLPHKSIEFCLRAAGITAADLDQLAIGWDTGLLLRQSSTGATHLPDATALDFYLPLRLFPQRRGRVIAVRSIEHHLAHAAGAFAAAPFDRSAVLVVDGSGEFASTSLAVGDRRTGVRILRSYPFSESLGIFYQALTSYVGFGPFQEGRLMGIAAYGTPRFAIEPDVDLDIAAPDCIPDVKENAVLKIWAERFERLTGRPAFMAERRYDPRRATARDELALSQLQKDMAASGQQWMERQVTRLAALAMREARSDRIVLTGGVALNCPANQKVAQMAGCRGVFVPSAPSDAGVSIGAACVMLWDQGVPVHIPRTQVYSGPSFVPAVVHSELTRVGARFRELADPAQFIAQAIAAQRIVARLDGALEFGPRALGNRSILADPRSISVRDRVNRIKGREAWRPLAPSVSADAATRFFEPADSPFMSFCALATAEAQREAPATIHEDGTARLQTVARDMNPGLSSVLDAVEAETGLPIVLNTSFNIGPEPVVCTPADAIRSFAASGIDVLVIDRFAVTKD